jgi:hypothetical protein
MKRTKKLMPDFSDDDDIIELSVVAEFIDNFVSTNVKLNLLSEEKRNKILNMIDILFHKNLVALKLKLQIDKVDENKINLLIDDFSLIDSDEFEAKLEEAKSIAINISEYENEREDCNNCPEKDTCEKNKFNKENNKIVKVNPKEITNNKTQKKKNSKVLNIDNLPPMIVIDDDKLLN